MAKAKLNHAPCLESVTGLAPLCPRAAPLPPSHLVLAKVVAQTAFYVAL